jgi:hypothetical protein
MKLKFATFVITIAAACCVAYFVHGARRQTKVIEGIKATETRYQQKAREWKNGSFIGFQEIAAVEEKAVTSLREHSTNLTAVQINSFGAAYSRAISYLFDPTFKRYVAMKSFDRPYKVRKTGTAPSKEEIGELEPSVDEQKRLHGQAEKYWDAAYNPADLKIQRKITAIDASTISCNHETSRFEITSAQGRSLGTSSSYAVTLPTLITPADTPRDAIRNQGSVDYTITTSIVKTTTAELPSTLTLSFFWSEKESCWFAYEAVVDSFGGLYIFF